MELSDQTFGIVLGLVAYVTANLGMGVQKLGSEALAQLGKLRHEARVQKKFGQWVLGTAMTIGGTLLLFPALAAGSASVIASFGGVGLVALTIFSSFVLGEAMKGRELSGVFLVALGTGLTGYFGDTDSAKPADLQALAVYGGCFLVLVALAIALSRKQQGTLPAIAYAASSGGFAGFGLMLQKMAGEVGLTLANPFALAWLLMTFFAFSLLQIGYLKGRAVLVVPSYTCMSILIPVAGAPVVFHESLSTILLVGLVLLLSGIVLLANPALEEQI